MRVRQLPPMVCTLVLAAACDRGATGDGDPPTKDMDPTGDASEESSSGGPMPTLGDLCEQAPVVGSGRYVATIYNAASDLDGACGAGGPEVFVRVATELRADLELEARGNGFVPRLGVLGSGCSRDWASEGLACGRGLPVQVPDVPAGGSVLVAIGVAPDDPVLAAAGDARDLSFALDVSLREVLAPGERCGLPGLGRCESGSACTIASDGAQRCAQLDADTCATASPHVLGLVEPLAIEIDPLVLQTDAHAHGCTGARRPERVIELRLPAALPMGSRLVARTDAADIGLALRGPGCLAADELACAPPSPSGATAQLDALTGVASVFVFVELPVPDLADPMGELAPFVVSFALESSP